PGRVGDRVAGHHGHFGDDPRGGFDEHPVLAVRADEYADLRQDLADRPFGLAREQRRLVLVAEQVGSALDESPDFRTVEAGGVLGGGGGEGGAGGPAVGGVAAR